MDLIKRYFSEPPNSGAFILLIYVAYNVTVMRMDVIASGNAINNTLDGIVLAGLMAMLLTEAIRMVAEYIRTQKQAKIAVLLNKQIAELDLEIARRQSANSITLDELMSLDDYYVASFIKKAIVEYKDAMGEGFKGTTMEVTCVTDAKLTIDIRK